MVLRHFAKPDLISRFESCNTASQHYMPEVDAKIIDGPVVVNMLPSKACATFSDYAAAILMCYPLRLLQPSKRLDVVWDHYIEVSLKKRDTGSRIIVKGSTPAPTKFSSSR